MPCLVVRTGAPATQIEEIFAALGLVLTVTTSAAVCEGCSATRDLIALV